MEPIPYGRHFIEEDDIFAVTQTLRSDFLTQGPWVDELEQKLADFHGCRFAVVFANGTAALHSAYAAAGVKDHDQCITTPMTFAATANAAVYCGGTPVLCDINPKNQIIDMERVWAKVTGATKTITPVSYGGYPADLRELNQRAREMGITVIYDAAHAIGAKRNGRGIADDADMTILSFHPVKHVAAGEGGAVLTNSQEFYEKLRLFRTHGITKDPATLTQQEGPWYYEMQSLGYNYRIPDILCALAISQMNKLEGSLVKRNQIAAVYDQNFSELDWLTTPENDLDRFWLETGKIQNAEDLHSYHLYPVLVDKKLSRLDFYNYLRSKNILVQVHYIPVHYHPFYQERFGYKRGDFPAAEDFYDREVSLPMFAALTQTQQEYVIDTVKKYSTACRK